MSNAPRPTPGKSIYLEFTRQPDSARYLAELRIYLEGIVPDEDIRRLLEETADHLETLREENCSDGEFGDPREVADHYIEAWYRKKSRLTPLERILGPGHMRVMVLFGMAALVYWALLQFRIFLPSSSPFNLPWSPGQIRRFFPEPLPFPEFSFQFLSMAGIPLLAPPVLGWIVGRIVPVRPAAAVYSVLMPMILISYLIGVLLLPVTDGLIFAVVQSVYWLPAGCGFAALSSRLIRQKRAREVACL